MILLLHVTYMIYVMFGDVILALYIYLSTQVAFNFWNYEFVFLESTTIWEVDSYVEPVSQIWIRNIRNKWHAWCLELEEIQNSEKLSC